MPLRATSSRSSLRTARFTVGLHQSPPIDLRRLIAGPGQLVRHLLRYSTEPRRRAREARIAFLEERWLYLALMDDAQAVGLEPRAPMPRPAPPDRGSRGSWRPFHKVRTAL